MIIMIMLMICETANHGNVDSMNDDNYSIYKGNDNTSNLGSHTEEKDTSTKTETDNNTTRNSSNTLKSARRRNTRRR